ncbi:hypothetical protein C8R43DRAFT_1002674 [Mycena crocata]|nr:hypothetical protein C8R43DRAFT_1002674 [Mycena crocata]
MSAIASISTRESIRWLPDEPSEPTQTIVLTALEGGVFLDVRFEKESGKLDWAFAGYRTSEEPHTTTFTHHIDSRTLDPLAVVDVGRNTPLPDGTILEAGEMVNPETGALTGYEEVWRDEEFTTALFVRNVARSVWRARVGGQQLALGRTNTGEFWAWQAKKKGDAWVCAYSTINSHDGGLAADVNFFAFLPEDSDCREWETGLTVEWMGETWEVLVHN